MKAKKRKAPKKAKRHAPATVRKNTAPKVKANKKRSRPKSSGSHRHRSKPNLGKIIVRELPKENYMATATKGNKGKTRHHKKRRSPQYKMVRINSGRRRTRRNAGGLGGLTEMVTNAVFVIAGAVGSKYATQAVLNTSNTGIMGYLGNLVAGFVLSWGVRAFMHNDKAAAAVFSGSVVQVVLRLIADYTPFGQYTSSLGMGDYLAQNYMVPQRLANGLTSAAITTQPGWSGLSGCGSSSLYGANGLY